MYSSSTRFYWWDVPQTLKIKIAVMAFTYIFIKGLDKMEG